MGFRYDTGNYSSQQRAIVGQRDKEGQVRKEESENKNIKEVQSEIVALLKRENKSFDIQEIAQRINRTQSDVLKAINRLENKDVDIEKDEQINKPRYKFKQTD
jgi:DNA-binding MarR family transcriptional regulator